MRLFRNASRPSPVVAPAWRRHATLALRVLWLVLLILPALLAIRAGDPDPWELDARMLLVLTCWLVLAARLALPARWFFPLSLPVALAGVLVMGGHELRHVDLLELGLQWRTFKAEEVQAALQPYAGPAALALLVLGAWCWACACAADPRRAVWAGLAGVVLSALVAAPVLPQAAWARAWPSNAFFVLITATSHTPPLVAAMRPIASVDPRDPNASWHARTTSTARRQTLVFIIGESVRADFLRECHGPDRVHPLDGAALVACDVTAGADATHTSVPLLVSRDMPGQPYRVSHDATFERAFKEAGFETHWIADQDRGLAWPDATFQAFRELAHSDADTLDPLLAAALARPARRKAIVLHTYGSHMPYCRRYDRATAPYEVDCETLQHSREPDAPHLRLAYANAVDASVRYIDGVIDTLRRQAGEVFLLYTPDHGDNLFDGPDELLGHALVNPSRWDVQVPAIFWANDEWRTRHPRQWANLQAQAAAPLMHADMVPTFLAAAGVAYDEPRKQAIDLLDAQVPPRRRIVMKALGVTTDWDTLVREAH